MRPKNPSLDIPAFQDLSDEEKLRHLATFGLLAPSSHNSQPWSFVFGENQIWIASDSSRELSISDPTKRQEYISIGACAENIFVAAKYFGLSPVLTFMPQNNFLAKISFSQGVPEFSFLPTMEAMLRRHNNRFPFEEKQIDPQFMTDVRMIPNEGSELVLVGDSEQKKEILETVLDATEEALNDQSFRNELSHWIKPSLKKYEIGMPGYNLGMPAPISFIFPSALRNFKMGKAQKNMDRKFLEKSAMFGILFSDNDSPIQWLKAGKYFEDIWLLAEERGMKVGVLTAAIEIGDYYQKLQTILKTNKRPLVFFRIGYTDKVPKKTPRLSLNKVIRAE